MTRLRKTTDFAYNPRVGLTSPVSPQAGMSRSRYQKHTQQDDITSSKGNMHLPGIYD